MPATDRKASEQLSTDLAALGAEQNTPDAPSGVPAALRRAPRPVREYLPPPTDGRTTYLQVAEHLQAAIAAGQLQPGPAFPSVWHDLVMPRRSRSLVEVRGISSTGVAVVDDTRREDDVSKRSLREKSESRQSSRLPLIDRSPALAYPE
jgi:hypothetical protein